MAKVWCVGGRQNSESITEKEFEKLNPKSQMLVKIIKGTCSICGRKKS